MTIRNGPKQIISTKGGVGMLRMVSESIIEQCASEDAGSQGEWIVRSHMDWRVE